MGLSNTPYQAWLVIGIALLAGFLIQALGLSVTFLLTGVVDSGLDFVSNRVLRPVAIVFNLLPFIGVGYGFYWYFTWSGPDQRTVTVAFVGGLLVKTLLIPLIKSLVTRGCR